MDILEYENVESYYHENVNIMVILEIWILGFFGILEFFSGSFRVLELLELEFGNMDFFLNFQVLEFLGNLDFNGLLKFSKARL